MKSIPLVLVAISGNRQCELFHHLKTIDVKLLTVECCRQVRDVLAAHPVDLVITDVSLTDGNWCDVVRHVMVSGTTAGIVVVAEKPTDTLWAEVFWRGAHDLLVAPYQAHEVHHVVCSALRRATFATETKGQGTA